MAGRKDDDNPFETAGTILAAVIFGPAFVLLLLGMAIEAITPALPFLVFVTAVAAIGYAVYRYQTSPFTIRREHEAEVLALLAQAEAQQARLPRQVGEDRLAAAFADRPEITDRLPVAALLPPAEAIWAEEFVRVLPPMPPVPLEAEKVYDVDYDRRTLKKGEEPPHRERTDGRGRPTTRDLESFKVFLHRYVSATPDPNTAIDTFLATYADVVAALCKDLPATDPGSPTTFTVPLIDLLPNGKAALASALAVLQRSDVRDRYGFSSVRDAFLRNRQRASEFSLRQRDIDAGAVLDPDQHPGSARAALDAYLGDSPLRPLFLTEVPFRLPAAKRFEGHWIVARQGSGKTNALECLIHADLAEVAAGRASLLVMDSQGTAPDTLIGRLASLKLFGKGEPLDGKLIYLEPDLDYPLALNVFDIGLADMGELSASEREDIVSSASEVVEFLFTGLLGGELSDNMTMLYKYLVPAMLAIPNADMNTFIELLDTDATRDRPVPAGFQKYRHHFNDLEPEVRSFLETDYLRDRELVKSKAAVRRRLRAAMADTTFRRMFMQPRNKLNLFRELQSAKVILVNTFPARTYVEPFGRLILALLMQATRQRLAIDRANRMPTYVYVDECQDYIAKEERIARYIDKCRKQNVGLVFAHQRLANIENPRVLNALSGMAIKFAGVSDADASDLAGHVASTADHIRELPRGTFAAYVSGLTRQAVDLTFPLSPFDTAPRLTRREWDEMRADMRRRYAVPHRGRSGAAGAPRPEPPDDTVDAEFVDVTDEDSSSSPPRLPPPKGDPGDDYDPLQ